MSGMVAYDLVFENETMQFGPEACFGSAKEIGNRLEFNKKNYPGRNPYAYLGKLQYVRVYFEKNEELEDFIERSFFDSFYRIPKFCINPTDFVREEDKESKKYPLVIKADADLDWRALWIALTVLRTPYKKPKTTQNWMLFNELTGNRDHTLNFALSHFFLKRTFYIHTDFPDPEHTLFSSNDTVKNVFNKILMIERGDFQFEQSFSERLGFDRLHQFFEDNGYKCKTSTRRSLSYPFIDLIENLCEKGRRITSYDNLFKLHRTIKYEYERYKKEVTPQVMPEYPQNNTATRLYDLLQTARDNNNNRAVQARGFGGFDTGPLQDFVVHEDQVEDVIRQHDEAQEREEFLFNLDEPENW